MPDAEVSSEGVSSVSLVNGDAFFTIADADINEEKGDSEVNRLGFGKGRFGVLVRALP